jgi:hypothetical protein
MEFVAAGFLIFLGSTPHAAAAPVTASRQRLKIQQELSALSYVCPMPQDAEVVDDKPGKCPKCGMTLLPVRLVSAWSCPTHTTVIQEKPGRCPIDKRDLVQITASVYFTCSDHPDGKELAPGKCADGKDRVKAFERRPHGDHNPRHGGQFFMVEDNWHHLEGAYPRANLFRVYFYNDFTQPIPPKGFSGRAEVLDALDNVVASIPLKPSTIRNALGARITNAKPPLKLKLWMKFSPTDKEHAFDFTFQELSKEPSAAAAVMTKVAPPPTPSQAESQTGNVASTAPSEGSPAPAPPLGVFDAKPALPITTPALLVELLKQNDQVQSLLGQGALGSVWFPAIATKDVALALDAHQNELSAQQRVLASAAVKRLVLAAWRIDAFGDLGDREKVTEASKVLAAAVADIKAAYGSIH